MITKFKLFESINELPKVNDYIQFIIKFIESDYDDPEDPNNDNWKKNYSNFLKFISNNIGIVINNDIHNNEVTVKYEKIPKKLKNNFYGSQNDEIAMDLDLPNEPEYIDEKIYFFGKTKEDVINQVDIYNKVKKYNI